MYFHESDLFPYEPISPMLMIIYILLSCWFFNILNQIIIPNKINETNWLKYNILLSCIHAGICSILIIIGVLRAPEIFQDPLSHINHFNYALIAFSTGYFLYDFIDCIKYSKSSTIAFLFHHVIVMAFFIHILYYTRNIGYAIYGLSIEINSFFLHARRVIRWHSPIFTSIYYNNLLKIIIDIGNYITFILFRFGIVIVGLRALHIQRNRLNPIVHIFTVTATSAIGILNIVLFYRLIKSQMKKKLKIKQEEQIEDNILITDNEILLPS
ncbi:unnamed protein product [Rotaria sp. Silwood1]|nr:unnamed protein product [Rotaria sp. Silwood1]CAF1503583.1 unnamed protein product [Rotaria sp. Silwood1]CAF3631393.1 unnamed protein product [Rotaria sp. Silwood1]CAF3684439.1 unnamed protein product [Rotaria sp. Silwood1]CAF4606887.1 unnamed protein product [Rotaria sp. Silwood1]